MFFNNKILIGKSDEKELYMCTNKLNRHGLITGSSGSGKTITLKVMAESFSEAGIPVFMADVKGDLARKSSMGTIDEATRNSVISNSRYKGKYDEIIDRESAFEKIMAEIKKREEL